jgi:metal-sulfur cluster biosynthetic enzyme
MRFEFPFPFCGDPETGVAVAGALARVVDPEMALGIVDLGLVYGVECTGQRVQVRMTMTSAACPVADLIVDDVLDQVRQALGDDAEVNVEVCWDPPWTPGRMSARARRAIMA